MTKRQISPRGLYRRLTIAAVATIAAGFAATTVLGSASAATLVMITPFWVSLATAGLILQARRRMCQRLLERADSLLCPECEYDMKHLVVEWNVTCPECGRQWTCDEVARRWHCEIWGEDRPPSW